MKILFALYTLVAYSSAQILLSAAAPGLLPLHVQQHLAAPVVITVPAATQYHAQNELGEFAFGHAGDNQARSEIKTLDGAVHGAYSYVDPNGKLNLVQYRADPANGFQVVANNLPEAPSAPAVDAPNSVTETPEVKAARAELEQKQAEAKAAAEASGPQSRRRRGILLSALSAPQATVKVQTLEVVDAPTPADTKNVELVEKEHQVSILAPAPHLIAVPHISSAQVPLIASQNIVAVPALAKATVKVQSVEAVDAPTPADTKKIALVEKEHEIAVPVVHHVVATPQLLLARKRRGVLLAVAPATATATVKVQSLQPVDAPTPADTKALELVEQEHKIAVPLISPLYASRVLVL